MRLLTRIRRDLKRLKAIRLAAKKKAAKKKAAKKKAAKKKAGKKTPKKKGLVVNGLRVGDRFRLLPSSGYDREFQRQVFKVKSFASIESRNDAVDFMATDAQLEALGYLDDPLKFEEKQAEGFCVDIKAVRKVP